MLFFLDPNSVALRATCPSFFSGTALSADSCPEVYLLRPLWPLHCMVQVSQPGTLQFLTPLLSMDLPLTVLHLSPHLGDDKYGRKIIVFSACRMPPSHQLDHSKLLG